MSLLIVRSATIKVNEYIWYAKESLIGQETFKN